MTKIAQPITPPTSTSTVPSVSAAPSTDPASATATPDDRSAALSQYAAFWAAIPSVAAAPARSRRPLLAGSAADPELASLLKGMAAQDAKHQRIYGAAKPRAQITSLDGATGTAVVTDCQDASHSGVEDVPSGRHLTVGASRNKVVSTMHRDSSGTWLVVYVTFPKSSC